MAKVPYGVETLPKILIVWVGRTNVTDRRQMDGRWHIANMNLSSRSLIKAERCSSLYISVDEIQCSHGERTWRYDSVYLMQIFLFLLTQSLPASQPVCITQMNTLTYVVQASNVLARVVYCYNVGCSVCLSVCHTRDPRLNSSRYRNTFCTNATYTIERCS